MANELYPKLALTNLGKNKSTYFPYMLTSIVCIMTYYIMQSIAMNEGLMEVPGAAIAMTIFFLGTGIIAVFCIALMFYTNSFLIKRRKKELGLYCVLGMEKRHVALVLFFETLFTAIACLALGLVFGVLFSKLLFMALLYLLDFATPLAFSVSVPSLVTTVVLFACIYGATLLYNMVHIRLANPVELLHGGQKGEKEPKTSWLLTFVGLAALAGGYFIAVYFKSPLNALLLFFVAVFLVILGTFCLFTAGSIALLKALRRRRNFYYRPNNFIAVSGMMYRMKQNAAGLAAICILSTMVLVTISTTVSLYMGRNDMVTSMYPREICSNSTAAENAPAVQDAFAQSTRALGLEIKNPIAGRSRSLNVISVDGSYEDAPASVSSGEVVAVSLVPLSDYNSTFGTNFQLASGEALAYPTGNFVLSDTVTLGGQAVQALGFIVGNSSTSLIAWLSVRSITRRSIPYPIPPVGGIPISSAFRKSSSVWLASSSPASARASCALKRSLWSIGSFSSEYALHISHVLIKSSKRSTLFGSEGFFLVSGEISIG